MRGVRPTRSVIMRFPWPGRSERFGAVLSIAGLMACREAPSLLAYDVVVVTY
jgi:hypothetical protein